MKTFFIFYLFCCSLFAADTIPLKSGTKLTGSPDVLTPSSAKTDTATPEPAPPAGAKPPKAFIAALDVYGTNRLNEASLRALLGKDLETWFDKGIKADPTAVELEAKLKEKIKKKYDFGLVEWSLLQYFEPGPVAFYVTLDVVEKKDILTRMPFLPAPTQEIADPDNLIKAWLEYEDKALSLVEQGKLEPETGKCPAFHCPFGEAHPDLKGSQKKFEAGVAKNEKQLVEVQKNHQNPDYRAAATYLLAYVKDGNRVVKYMLDRIKDTDHVVRNNALRVLGDIAEQHPEYIVPAAPLIEALKFPFVTDRSKSLYALFHLASNSRKVRDDILQGAVPELLKLLETKQPDQYELSHGILRKISGKDYTSKDLRAWNQWYSQMKRETANKK